MRVNATHCVGTIGAAIVVLMACFAPGLQVPVYSEQTDEVIILSVTEIKEEGSDDTLKKIPLEKVEEATNLTKDRVYGLIALWSLIIIAVFLVRYQLRDDERLYRQGYYKK